MKPVSQSGQQVSGSQPDSVSQGTQADVLRLRCSQKQLASQSQLATSIQQKCGPALGEESVIKMVRHRLSVSQIQLVKHRWSLINRMQLEPLSQTLSVRPRCPQPDSGSQSTGQADGSPVLVHQAPIRSVFSQAQPDRLGLSGGDGMCGQSQSVGQMQPAGHSQNQ